MEDDPVEPDSLRESLESADEVRLAHWGSLLFLLKLDTIDFQTS